MSGYDADLAAVHAAGFTALARAAAREVLARVPGRSRIVDLGCGDGTTAGLLAAAGHEVIGLDLSPAMVALARRAVPDAEFRVGSFVDADLPRGCDAVLAIGEVLGYALDDRNDHGTLDAVLARVRRALAPGGLFLFDLAGPGRGGPSGTTSGWADGDGWSVLYRAREDGDELVREIVTYRAAPNGLYRRAEEVHRLRLHPPDAVLARLRAAGFAAHTLRGYDGETLPAGWMAFVAD